MVAQSEKITLAIGASVNMEIQWKFRWAIRSCGEKVDVEYCTEKKRASNVERDWRDFIQLPRASVMVRK